VSAYYDANGNMTSGAGATFTYDEANRVSTVAETSGGEEYYGYDASNKRIYVRDTSASEWFTFYGADGKKLGKYQISGSGSGFAFSATTTSVWFGGRLIMDSGSSSPGFMYQDRLGSNRTYGMYNPFGEGMAGNDNIEFATYLRDSYTGLDYADQRFYASTYGRFNTADPYQASAGPSDPGSWNRYAYVEGDPVNAYDPRGLDTITISNFSPVLGPYPFEGMSPPQVDYCLAQMEECLFYYQMAQVQGGTGSPPTAQQEWSNLSPTCQQGLKAAVGGSVSAMVGVLNGYTNYASMIGSAAQAHGLDPAFLAAIALEENDFQNTKQQCNRGVTWGTAGCAGAGIFQIDLYQNPGVSLANALNPSYSANWAASTLATDEATLAAKFPNFTPTQLLQATAAAYNLGIGGISGNPATIDGGTQPHGNYGATVLQLMKCF
jgi:RHS repeat-associated protein